MVRNVGAWYEAFSVKPGDKLYLKPEDRLTLWKCRPEGKSTRPQTNSSRPTEKWRTSP